MASVRPARLRCDSGADAECQEPTLRCLSRSVLSVDDVPELNGPTRWLLLAAGWLALFLALVGVVLPLLPTTPFVLVAAACFARSSPRLHQRLLANRVFGPLIVDWSEHRAVPLRAKLLAVSMIAITGALTIGFVLETTWQRVLVGTTLATVSIWLISRPTAERS